MGRRKEKKYLEQKLKKQFEWEIIPACREHKKGRAKGGFLIGINKRWRVEIIKLAEQVEEGLIKTQVMYEGRLFTILSIYNGGEIETTWKHLE